MAPIAGVRSVMAASALCAARAYIPGASKRTRRGFPHTHVRPLPLFSVTVPMILDDVEGDGRTRDAFVDTLLDSLDVPENQLPGGKLGSVHGRRQVRERYEKALPAGCRTLFLLRRPAT